MEDVERKQLVEFISNSACTLSTLCNELSHEKYGSASVKSGYLLALHKTLLETLESEKDCDECDEEYVNKCSEGCEMMDAIRALHKQANQCRK